MNFQEVQSSRKIFEELLTHTLFVSTARSFIVRRTPRMKSPFRDISESTVGKILHWTVESDLAVTVASTAGQDRSMTLVSGATRRIVSTGPLHTYVSTSTHYYVPNMQSVEHRERER